MRQIFRRYMSFVLTAFLCICLLPSAIAKAAEAPKDPTIEIPVEVTAEGSVPSEPETYVVRLTAVTDDAPMPDGASGDTAELSIQGPGEGAFSFTYRRTGVYQYKIFQVAGTSTICEYDATVYDLYVYVTRNAENGLEINAYMKNGTEEGKPETAAFRNLYGGSAEYAVSVKKVVDVKSGTAPKDSVFTFRMTPSEASDPMPGNADASGDGFSGGSNGASSGAVTMDVTGAGEYSFGKLTFDGSHCGKTFVYTIEEIDKGEAGYTYDPNVFKLTIKVSAAEDGLSLEAFITDDGGEHSEMVFTNTYEKGKTPDKPDKPGKPGKPGKSTRTGDDNNFLLWMGLVVVSVGAIAGLVFLRKRNGRQ